MKFIIAIVIFAALCYAIPSNIWAAQPLVMGQFRTTLKQPNNVRYDEICVRDNMTDPVKCSHYYMNAKMTNGVSPNILFSNYDTSSPICKGVKVTHVDIGMHHQDFSNCYMAWCVGESTQNIHIDFSINKQNQIICTSSNLMP